MQDCESDGSFSSIDPNYMSPTGEIVRCDVNPKVIPGKIMNSIDQHHKVIQNEDGLS